MRRVSYPSRGRPTTLSQDLEELTMLLQAALEIANTERWAFQLGAAAAPTGLPNELRTASYEVTVVDVFHRIIRDWVERRGLSSVWERPLLLGTRGAPPRIDIAFFDAAKGEEWRLELGLYKKKKLRDDSSKLVSLTTTTLAAFPSVKNLVLLWQIKDSKLTQALMKSSVATFKADATAASTTNCTVQFLMSSGVDLFTARSGGHRHGLVSLFSVA